MCQKDEKRKYMASSVKRTIKACVFDLGNTLINDSLLLKNTVEDMSRWLQERELVNSQEDFLTTFLRVNYETNKPFISHTFGEVEFFQKAFEELGVRGITAEEGLNTYRDLLLARMEPDPGIAETFKFLRDKGIRIALLSNERAVRVDAYLEKTKLRPFFDAVVVSETVGVEKPHRHIFQEVLTKLQVRGDEAAMFGDNRIADGASKEWGFLFVLVTAYRNPDWGWEEGLPYPPDHVMGKITPAEMQEFLSRSSRIGMLAE
jgi:putative hydrolase of the HAD superfamily